MSQFRRRLRTPEERVGMLPNACLPPPAQASGEDELLLRALRQHDERAFALVLERYFPAMLRVALAHVATRATAEEVIQETWMAALRGIARFEGRSSVKTWLFRILRNLARTRGKRDARMSTFTDLERTADGGPPAGPELRMRAGALSAAPLWSRSRGPEEDVLGRELAAHLERAIATLPPRQREVLVLRDVEGWTGEEVCNAMGITQTNQRVILHRARERVRNEIRPYFDGNTGCVDEGRTDVL